ncbi:MAG TPA: hypothetical protein VEK84_10050 [Terriglobales bacterium]|nr:hypothetical protein [Terriglobales bacterium]
MQIRSGETTCGKTVFLVGSLTAMAKASAENKLVYHSAKALRHPKSSAKWRFSASCEAPLRPKRSRA